MAKQGEHGISWTEQTWNPLRGCSKVSEGCRNCYAMSVAARFSGAGQPYEGLAHRVGGKAQWTNEIKLVDDHLFDPLRWTKPRMIFVNSMSDLFHEQVPEWFIDKVFGVMATAKHHTYQVLTKRPERMRDYFLSLEQHRHESETGPTLPNVWLGVSIEDQKTADERIPFLINTPAAVWWVSYEPALGPIDFSKWLFSECPDCEGKGGGRNFTAASLDDGLWDCDRCEGTGRVSNPDISWIVVGGESGPGARPFDLQWARQTVSQCCEAEVPVFCKQMGSNPVQRVVYGASSMLDTEKVNLEPVRLKDRKGGDPEEWPEDIRVRQWPK